MNKETPTDLTKAMQPFIDCANKYIQEQKKESKILDIMLFICLFVLVLLVFFALGFFVLLFS